MHEMRLGAEPEPNHGLTELGGNEIGGDRRAPSGPAAKLRGGVLSQATA